MTRNLWILAACALPLAAQPLPEEAAREKRIAVLKGIVEASPKDVGSWHDLAGLLREARRWDEAVAAESQAIAGHPKYAVAFWGRGVARMEKRDYAAASEDFTSAIGLWEKRGGGPDYFITTERPRDEYVDSYRNRGVCSAHLGKLPAAIADLTTAVRLNPDDPKLLSERGRLHEKAGKAVEATADFRRAGLVYAEARYAAGARDCAERLRKLGARDAAAEIEAKLDPPKSGTDLP